MKRLLLAGCTLALAWPTHTLAQAKFNGRYVVSIDFGQQQKLVSLNLFRDAAGKVVEFNSAMDALNWLNAQGWELASTFVLVDDGASVAYYVLRRRLPS
jgi:hypothetical protein